MIQDTQEYLQHWEKENNPFYPSEMRWDRLQVNRFLKDYKQQLILPVVSQRSELLPDFLYKDDFGIKIGYHGDTEVSEEWNDYLKKLGNCG